MRKIQLTSIGLSLSAETIFAEGAVLVVGDDIPDDIAMARLAAGTAIIVVDDGDLSPAFLEAVAAYDLAVLVVSHAMETLLTAVEAGGRREAVAFMEHMSRAIEGRELLKPRFEAIEELALAFRLGEDATHQSEGGASSGQTADQADSVSSSAGGEGASSPAGSVVADQDAAANAQPGAPSPDPPPAPAPPAPEPAAPAKKTTSKARAPATPPAAASGD